MYRKQILCDIKFVYMLSLGKKNKNTYTKGNAATAQNFFVCANPLQGN